MKKILQSSPLRQNGQRGFSLLELVVAIAIMGGVMAGVTALISRAQDDTNAAVTGLHLKTVGEAANEYIKDNYAAITGIATATTPVLIRVSDLIAGGHLTAGYSVTNPRNQNTCVLVLEPTANNLTGLVITEGGDTVDDLTLGQVAATIGGAGGGVYSTAPSTVRGAMGGWSFAAGAFANANHLGMRCDGVTAGPVSFSAGHPAMALWFADGASVSATLYRDAVPGNPALNTMNTPIIMGAGTVQTVNGACTNLGAMGRDATGKVLMCDGANWKQQGSAFWGDPVANFASLPACNAASINVTRIVAAPSVGSGRRAYTCNGAGTWEPLGVNDAGHLNVPGNLTTNGRLTTNEYVQVNGVATEGWGCAPNGLVGRNASGLLLSCQSGVWKKAQGDSGGFYSVAGACSVNNPKTGALNCPAGFNPYTIYVDWYGWGHCPGSMALYACM